VSHPVELTPEQAKKQAQGCYLGLLVWLVGTGPGVLGSYLYDSSGTKWRMLHLVVGCVLGFVGTMVSASW
jgi:hypothetical protein